MGSPRWGCGIVVQVTISVNDALGAESTQEPWVQTAIELLRGLLRLRTVNPPGREEAAALHLARFGDASGVRTEVIPWAAGRAHVILEAPGTRSDLAPVVAVAHSDVVPAGRGWTRPPFGGILDDGFVWGRGAIDAKGVAAIWATVLARFAAEGGPARSVRLIVAAGEEDPRGALADLLDARPDLARAHAAVGEGGGYVRTHGGSWFTAVGAAECARVRVSRPHEPSPVVTPPRPPSPLLQHLDALSIGAPARQAALVALADSFPAEVDARAPTFERWVRGVAEAFALPNDVVATWTVAQPIPRTFSTRHAWTEYSVPPGSAAPAGAQAIWPATHSGTDEGAYAAIEHALSKEHVPGVGRTRGLPMLSRGRTDLVWFRLRGVPSYGFFPLDPTDRPESMHRPDERLSIAAVRRALTLLDQIARTLAGAPAAGRRVANAS